MQERPNSGNAPDSASLSSPTIPHSWHWPDCSPGAWDRTSSTSRAVPSSRYGNRNAGGRQCRAFWQPGRRRGCGREGWVHRRRWDWAVQTPGALIFRPPPLRCAFSARGSFPDAPRKPGIAVRSHGDSRPAVTETGPAANSKVIPKTNRFTVRLLSRLICTFDTSRRTPPARTVAPGSVPTATPTGGDRPGITRSRSGSPAGRSRCRSRPGSPGCFEDAHRVTKMLTLRG